MIDLKEDDLHIWRYILDEEEYHAEKSMPLLSDEEHQRCDWYMNETEKIRYICNHRFVRQVLSKYMNIPASEIIFCHAKMGKPFIKNSNLFFNYSYRSSLGLLALSKKGEVGVDIEKIKVLQDPPTFASFSFSEKESNILFKSDPENFQDILFTFWTFKEAIIKALGVGLNADLTKIDLADFLYSDLNPLAFEGNAIYTIKELKVQQGYKAAFAIKGQQQTFTEYNYFKD